MQDNFHRLILEDIHCYSYHGCLKEEERIGSSFTVSLELEMNLSIASETDKLKDTADYVLIHRIVREEMAIHSKLIEHVAGRILKRLRKELPFVHRFIVKVKKLNPPVNGQLGSAMVILHD
jgi:7,8-dihydroneopterin aldolase/epimerase/oxygenase